MLKRLKIQLEDTARFHPVVRNLLAASMLLRVRRRRPRTTSEAAHNVNRLCQAARLATSDGALLKVEAAIGSQLTAINPSEIPWADFLPDFGSDRIGKAIVLKPWISEREKGVVFISFDNQMARLVKGADLAGFAQRYTIVLSPQWSPPHSVAAYLTPMVYPGEIVSLISNTRDLTYLPRISSKYSMVPLYASSWVDPRKYTPVPVSEKNIDIFMLANFAKYKRHHALFAAMRELPRGYRIVLVGQRERGRTRETILAEAAAFGVADRFEIRENVSEQELHDTFVRAKVSLILSRREGSCVAVVESMFANTPVGVFEDAEVGSRAFVNEHTGKLLKESGLGAQLRQFVDSSASFEPRKWVMENGVDCISSSRTLNNALRDRALSAGGEWSQDIATLRWRPDPQLYDPSEMDRLLPAYKDIEQRYNLFIGPKLS